MTVRRLRVRATSEERVISSSLASRRTSQKDEETTPARRVRTRRGGVAAPLKARAQVVEIPAELEPFNQAIARGRFKMQHTRPGHYLHVSDLISKCVRQRAIHNRLKVAPATRKLTLSDMLTFAQGDAIHDVLKEQLRLSRPDRLWGKWSCKCESLMHDEPCTFDEVDQEEECPHCHTKVTKYHEVSMFDEELWVVGNPDVILWLEEYRAYHVTELKSMADTQFKELTRPKPEHVLQVVWYWYLMGKLGYPLTDRVSIVYASKAWSFNKADREFVIDPRKELHRIEEQIEDARAYRAAYEDKKAALPLRSMCASNTTKAAKECMVCDTCFAQGAA